MKRTSRKSADHYRCDTVNGLWMILLLGLFLLVPSVGSLGNESSKGKKPQVKLDLERICLELATVQEPEVDIGRMRKELDALEGNARIALKSSTSPHAASVLSSRVPPAADAPKT